MAKRSNLILLLVSLVLALIATLVIIKTLPKAGGSNIAAPVTATTSPVVVVTQNIPALTVITSADVQVQQVPAGSVEHGALTDPSQVIGQYASTGWVTGQQVIQGMYETAAQANIANTVPVGDVTFTIPNSALAGSDYLVLPGDKIDLLFYGQPSATASTVMSNLKVLYVDHVQAAAGADTQPAGSSGADSLTVIVTPQQAQQLAKLVSTAIVGNGTSPGNLHVLIQGTK
ncbi:Flp pilus assembly protein CpaB [Alicyclobacillus sp. ALC3]|uniref:Flp pilus assembly protein CpaB n=1 Tax=Alicyclobacillus sp. ALC3 TaxID=2796143 RepID=UPI0023790863|nr:Flp pilus assembly protein CpaB [Alicyclobacillus sp. ALC3]WDL95313.1 Flp pilus assembly protein CpaB [Alicyclobacillus sp. ALC3]